MTEIWALVSTLLDRLAVPKGHVWVGKGYELAELRADLQEIMRLCDWHVFDTRPQALRFTVTEPGEYSFGINKKGRATVKRVR